MPAAVRVRNLSRAGSFVRWGRVAVRFAVTLMASGTLAGCGGPKQAPPAKAPAAAASVRVATEELSPINAPEDLFLVGRLRSLDDWFDEVNRWSGVPVDVRTLLDRYTGGMLRTVRLEGPLEFAALADPDVRRLLEPDWVVAVGLRSAEQLVSAIRGHGGDVVSGPNGLVYTHFDARLLCAVAPALGPSHAKLVCGPDRDAIDALLPYATRGIQRYAFGDSDLELTLLGDPLERLYAVELRQLAALGKLASRQFLSGDPAFDQALASSIEAVVEEATFLVEDTREVALRVSLPRGQSPLNVELFSEFSATRSWLVEAAIDVASRAGSAPADFFTLPADATSAWFNNPMSAAHFEPLRAALHEVVGGGLSYLGLSDGARQLWLDVWDGVVQPLRAVGAAGEIPEQPSAAAERAWHVWKIDKAPEAVTTTLRAFVKALANKESRRRLESLLSPFGFSADDLPTAKERAAMAPAPRGARTFELEIPAHLFQSLRSKVDRAASAPATTTQRWFVVVVPDEDETWVASDTDEARAMRRVQSLLRGEASTLAGRPELEPLKQGRYAGGGFFTLTSLQGAFQADGGTPDFGSLPNGGKSPILFWWSAERSPTASITAELAVPGAALRDVSRLFGP